MLAQFVILFVLTNALGLLFANAFLPPEVTQQISQAVNKVSDDRNDPANAVGLLAYILGATAVLLVIIKFFKSKVPLLLRLFEGYALFFITLDFFGRLVFPFFSIDLNASPDYSFLAFMVALTFILLRNILHENILLRNASIILLVSYVGALIGTGFGLWVMVAFAVLLSVYDLIAVFKTKHMVVLAEAVTKKNLAFTYAIPTQEHQFELGTGDIVIPLAFATAVLQQYHFALAYPTYFLPAILILVASFTGLLATLEYSSRNIGKALPALPLQTVFMVLVVLVLQFLVPV